jgi:type II secretory pathway pseudopilin PulG
MASSRVSIARPCTRLRESRLGTTSAVGVAEAMAVTRRREAGFALIDLLFVVGLIGIISVLAMPRLLLARQSAGAASAIGSLRAISSAQLTFALTCGGGFYAPALTALGTPPPGSNEAFISDSLSRSDSVIRSGYLIQLEATPFPGSPSSCNGLAIGEAGQAYKAAADPAGEPVNKRFFATNANGLIFEHTSSMYGAMPEVGEPPVGGLLK